MFDITRVLAWAIAIRTTSTIPSFDALRARIGASIEATGEPARDDFAEISAGGLLTNFAQQVECIAPTPGARTPDFHTVWGDNSIVEVEVTRADEKIEQKNRRLKSGGLAEDILDVASSYDLTVHVSDTLGDGDRRELLLAARIVKPSEPIDHAETWNIYAEEIPVRPGDSIDIKPEEFISPSWWPEQVAEPFVVRAKLAPAGSSDRFPKVRLKWFLSVAAYINPIEKKAARFQGSGSNPFLVAIDVTYLPGAFKWYEQYLPGYFKVWPSISGVLAFETQVSLERVSWQWQLYTNPNGSNPLPLVAVERFRTGRWKIGFDLWTKKLA